MNFGQALEKLKKGESIRRHGWNGAGMWLDIQEPDLNSKMTHPYMVMHIPKCPEGLRLLPWQPAQVDLFAEDWEIIK